MMDTVPELCLAYSNVSVRRKMYMSQLRGEGVSLYNEFFSLIQATLGCLPIQEFALNQDSQVW